MSEKYGCVSGRNLRIIVITSGHCLERLFSSVVCVAVATMNFFFLFARFLLLFWRTVKNERIPDKGNERLC